MSPFVHAIIQVVGITGASYDLNDGQADQRHHVEEECCSLAPRADQPANNFMILDDVCPTQSHTDQPEAYSHCYWHAAGRRSVLLHMCRRSIQRCSCRDK